MKMNDNGIIREMTKEEIEEMQDVEISKQARIESLIQELRAYDYIGVKIAMGVATREEYAEQIAYTQQLRREINELESEVEENAGTF